MPALPTETRIRLVAPDRINLGPHQRLSQTRAAICVSPHCRPLPYDGISCEPPLKAWIRAGVGGWRVRKAYYSARSFGARRDFAHSGRLH